MRSYELLDHTADVLLQARGDSLAELLVACAEGMFSVLVEGGEIEAAEAEEILVEADDAEELLHAWLRELLFRFSAEGMVFGRFELHEASPTRLRATCRGERFDPARHQGGAEIKAVTYHNFNVEHTDEGWLARVLFDI